MSQLTEREEKIIRARFREEPMSPEQVAKWLGIPGALARQLEWKALRKLAKTSPELRQYLNEKGVDA
jgi:DNA-directed RNA polymerase sigma subunit (sigma70/sigma32)